MIKLKNAKATRLAFKIASWSDGHLGHVMLDADGSMWATDGIVMIRSLNAHDAEIHNPLFVSCPKVGFSLSPESFSLSIGEGVLIEHRARSEASYEANIESGIKYPVVRNAIPNHLSEGGEMPHFDSIIAGKVAHEYGLKRGIWVSGPGDNRVYLKDVEDDDLVMLAGIVLNKD